MIENNVPERNTCFLNVFQPKDALNGQAADISVKRIKGEHCIGIKITSHHTVETFLFSETNQINYGDIKSQSKWVSIIKDKVGKTLKKTQYNA